MKINKKIIILLVSVTVLLTITVSGTVAFLADGTESVENKFTPTTVTTTTTEDFDNKTKSSVVINNTSNIPVYIRVAVIGSWMKDGKVVDDWTPTFTVGSDWFKSSDGFYYYRNQVAADGSTSDLLGSNIEAITVDGKTLTVTVINQAIQGEPATAVQNAWGVTVNAADKTISKP